MTVHNQEALQEFADLAKQGGKPLPFVFCPICGERHKRDEREVFGVPVLVCPNAHPNEIHFRDLTNIGSAVAIARDAALQDYLDHKNWYMIGDPQPPLAVVTGESSAEVVTDYVGAPTGRIEFGQKRKFL